METADDTSSLSPLFIPVGTPSGPLADLTLAEASPGALRRALDGLPFNTVYDYIRAGARILALQSQTPRALAAIAAFDDLLTRVGDPDRRALDIHAALLQVAVALNASSGNDDDALASAITALTLLAQEPKRKDEPFLAVLASLLFDMAGIYTRRGEHRQAERSLDKATNIFQRLARQNPERYAPAHVATLNAASQACQTAKAQTKVLTECQEATARYLALTREGSMDNAIALLADSLGRQGITLARMGRHREAIQLLSRALRYLTRLQPEPDLNQIQLSTELGLSLLLHRPTREKGIHLLNTMLHKTSRLGADDLHRRIVRALADANNPARIDILGMWHKIFPR